MGGKVAESGICGHLSPCRALPYFYGVRPAITAGRAALARRSATVDGDGSDSPSSDLLISTLMRTLHSCGLHSDGIASQELSVLLATDRVIPIVHGTTFEELRKVSPLLAARSGLTTSDYASLHEVATKIADTVLVDEEKSGPRLHDCHSLDRVDDRRRDVWWEARAEPRKNRSS